MVLVYDTQKNNYPVDLDFENQYIKLKLRRLGNFKIKVRWYNKTNVFSYFLMKRNSLMKVVRLFTGQDQKSHFQEVEMELFYALLAGGFTIST